MEVDVQTNAILTLEEISRMLRVDKATVYRMARSRRIPAVKVGRQWRFEKSEIDQWLKKQYT